MAVLLWLPLCHRERGIKVGFRVPTESNLVELSVQEGTWLVILVPLLCSSNRPYTNGPNLRLSKLTMDLEYMSLTLPSPTEGFLFTSTKMVLSFTVFVSNRWFACICKREPTPRVSL